MKTLIVGGSGHVGQALFRRLAGLGHSVSTFGSGNARSTFTDRADQSDVVFVTIPTRDTGEIALRYLLDALRIGKPVITCEKGALAYHYRDLKPYLRNIGYTATVGGGSGMLNLFLFPHIHLKQIIGVVNGTLNFLFSECDKGKDPYRVITAATRLGLCEPGQSDLAGVVNGEIQDMVLKLVNLVNFSGVSNEILCANEFGSLYLSESEILKQLNKKSRRFVISISKEKSLSRDGLYDGLHVCKGGWHAEIGIVDVSSLPFKMIPRLEENTLCIEDHAGITQITGKGAGAIPTAAAMIGDMSKVCN